VRTQECGLRRASLGMRMQECGLKCASPANIEQEGTIMTTLETIQAVMQEKLDIDPAQVTPEATFETLQLDSLDIVEVICELEDTLDIDFGEPEGLNTIADVVAYIDSLR